MSRVVITVTKGKDVKTLTYDGAKSIIINNGGRRYVITPSRIDIDVSDGSGNVIRVNTRGGSYDVPIDWDYKYIIVWYNKDDEIIAHADIDGRFTSTMIKAWP
jgi:hypothetical protein